MDLKPYDGEYEPTRQPASNLKPYDGEFTPIDSKADQVKPEGFVANARQGFKRALPETKSLLAGAGAAVAGAVGADGIRDSLLDTYQEIDRTEVRPLASDTSFTGVLSGEDNLGDWAGDTLGNFGGQALQSIAAAGAGAVVGSALPGAGTVGGAVGGLVGKSAVKKLVGNEVAEMVAERAATAAGRKKLAGMAAGTAAATAINTGQEIGIGYTGRAEDAAAAGEQLNQGDALRAIGWGVPAGLLDTAAEAFLAKGLFKGASADPKFIKRMLAGMAKGGIIEGGTEGAQAFLERMGANQDVATHDAFLDYVNNAAAGALGGGVAGAGSGFKRQDPVTPPPAPEVQQGNGIDPNAGPISKVAAQADGVQQPPAAPPPAGPIANVAAPAEAADAQQSEAMDALFAQHQEEKANLYRVSELIGLDPLEVDALDDSGVGDLAGLSDNDLGWYAATLVGIPSENIPQMLEQLRQSAQPLTAPAETAVPGPAASSDLGQETPSGQTIEVGGRQIGVTNPRADDGNEIVMLDAQKADQSFSTSDVYVGRDGSGGDQRRYQGVGSFLQTADSMDAPEAYMDESGLRFTDGRHRFAYLRDTGSSSIPVSMSPESAQIARDLGLTTPTDPATVKQSLTVDAPEQPATPAVVKDSLTTEQQDQPAKSEQFESYRKWIAAGKEVSPGMLEQISADPRLNDGEAAELAGMAAGGKVAIAAADAATSPTNDLPQPTDAQKDAGNYKKGHVVLNGMDISIENPAGTSRRPEWPPLANHYGYIKGTIGKDKDHVDVFMTDRAEDASLPVFVVDQYDPKTGKFDEHKVILGAATGDEAMAAYKSNYSADWTGGKAVTQMSQDEFKAWVRDANKTKKPAAQSGPATDFIEVTDRAGKTHRVRQSHLDNAKISKIPTYDAKGARINKDLPRASLAAAETATTPDSFEATGKLDDITPVRDAATPYLAKINAKSKVAKVKRYRVESSKGVRYLDEVVLESGGAVYVMRDADGKFLAESGAANSPIDNQAGYADFYAKEIAGADATVELIGDEAYSQPATKAADPIAEPVKPSKPAAPAKLSKSDVDAMLSELYNEFVSRADLIGKDVEAVTRALLETADPGVPQKKIDQLARRLVKAIKDNADALQKNTNRDPAVRNRAISDALGDEPDADKAVAFTSGFHHALSGKTKSTLSGEHLDERIRGYQEGRKWIKTGEGKAWFDGVPYKKLQNTGVDLRRWFDQLKSEAEAGKTSGEKLWAAMKKMTVRADLFPINPDDDATPGVTRMMQHARDHMTGFLDYLSNWSQDGTRNYLTDSVKKRESWGARRQTLYVKKRKYYYGTLDERASEFLNNLLTDKLRDSREFEADGETYKTISSEDVYNALLGVAEDYISGVVELHTAMRSAKTAQEAFDAGERFRKENKDAFTRLFREDINGNWRGSKSAGLFQSKEEGVSYQDYEALRIIGNDGAPIEQNNRSKAMVPPRLDRVTREGLTDHRGGVDMTPERFKADLGFADVGFGSWVSGEGGQDHLNYAYDAFMDLAKHFGIPANMIGLGGKLHFTIGALGHGKHAAHYQKHQAHPDGGTVPVINVTNTKGDGTVYHEWAHAFDLTAQYRGWPQVRAKIVRILHTYNAKSAELLDSSLESFLLGRSWYSSMKKDGPIASARHFLDLRLRGHGQVSAYKKAADELGKDYWGNDKELFARAVEAWSFDSLGGTSTYLVGSHVAEGAWSKEKGYRGTPYPTGEERIVFGKVLDALRKAVSVKNGEFFVDPQVFEENLPSEITDPQNRIRELLEEGALEEMRQALLSDREAKARAREAAEKRAEEDAAAAALAELEAAERTAAITSPEPMGAMTADEFDSMFDDVVAELEESKQETPDAEPAGQQVRDLQDKPKTEAEQAQERTAKRIAASIAKSGVKGLDESMLGLVKLFGGGPGRLNSFPGGLDEDAYKAAKPHFEAALKQFQAAGQGMREFIKYIAEAFGAGIKPYLARFVQESKLSAGLANTEDQDATSVIAEQVREALHEGESITWRELFAMADEAFGGTQAEGKYGPKDAYDAVEAGVNRFIMANRESFRLDTDAAGAVQAVGRLEELTDLLPTQTKRTAEMDEFQQFSTVPPLAYMANWVAAPTRDDTVMEPSAGIGGLAVFSRNAGAKLILNELSARRAAVLQTLFPDTTVHTENAEHIDRILDDDLVPTLVVMNPPFSATAGRLSGDRDTNIGAQHLEQALARLADGGRLVAIVGQGMARDKAAFKSWWAKIDARYDVRAALPIDGSGYAKYGTTFDNVLIVIDKVKPSGRPVVDTEVKEYNQLAGILLEIRNDRPDSRANPSTTQDAQREPAEPARPESLDDGRGDTPGTEPDRDGPAVVGDGERPRVGGGTGERAGRAVPDRSGRRVRPADGRDRLGPDAGQDDRGNGATDGSGTGVTVAATAADTASELTDSVFSQYRPQRLSIPGSQPHPGNLVESAAMATVLPPAPTYTPNLPAETINEGKASLAQLESAVYAGQAHEQTLPDGSRRGFFIGDGTGVGKGREIATIILDNLRQGRKKALWISEKGGLLTDAKRDMEGVGGNPALIRGLSDVTDQDWKVSIGDGIVFSTYATLRSKQQWKVYEADDAVVLKDGRTGTLGKVSAKNRTLNIKIPGSKAETVSFDAVLSIDGDTEFLKQLASGPPADWKPRTRLQQITEWLGPDFDGVIAFDEAHNAGNAVGEQGTRGAKDSSAQALAVMELQRALPKARVVYVSATGATKVENLAYTERLGLWGQGTAFSNVTDFITKVKAGGLAIMELVARDLKQMGVYLARSLSYADVTYDRLEHNLNDIQLDIYDKLAEAWQVVLRDIDAALELTNIKSSTGKTLNKEAVNGIKSLFWGTQQRFFSQIITAMQMPSVLAQIDTDLESGKAVVIQLVNTNEAAQEKSAAKAKKKSQDGETEIEEEFDMSPRDQLIDMVKKAFPIYQYEVTRDKDGKDVSVAVHDNDGNQVANKEALARRDALIAELNELRYPDSPLEQLINYYGPDKVAEITGRKRRFVSGEHNPGGTGKTFEQKRGPAEAKADANAFMADKKQILVFSDAGGTGYSFHASRKAKNQRKRHHYLLQPGWRAYKAVQGFGRTHRTDQASSPHYFLVATDIPAHKRFLSSIARRMDQLGALTRGQRDTTSQGMFSEKDNLESKYAIEALRQLLGDIQGGNVEGLSFREVIEQLGFGNIVDPSTGKIADSKFPPVPQFLNRMLSMRVDMQRKVFDAFMFRMEAIIDDEVAKGTYDTGMQTLRALSVDVVHEEVVHTDERTGAPTNYIQLSVEEANTFYDFPHQSETSVPLTYVKQKTSGRVYAFTQMGSRTNARTGAVMDTYAFQGTGGRYRKTQDEIYDRSGKLIGLEEITESQAVALWSEENAKRPPTIRHEAHMITGALLTVWDRLGVSQGVNVVRVQTTDGRLHLGVKIPNKDVKDVRKRFNISSEAAKMAPIDVMKAVLSGRTAELVNGWKLVRSLVSGQSRIEIKNKGVGDFTTTQAMELTSYGLFMERIGYYHRYFVPTSAAGADVMAKLIATRPIVDFDDPVTDAKAEGQFSKPDLTGRGVTVAQAREALGPNADHKDVVLVQTAEELPAAAKSDPGYKTADGYYDGQRAYVVADNLRSAAHARIVLAHELIGHLGMEAVTGPELWAQIDKAVTTMEGRDEYRALFAEIKRRYPDADRTTFVKEAIAIMAEKGFRNSVLDRVAAAIRQFLRKLGLTLPLSDAELRAMVPVVIRKQLAASAQYVKTGDAQQGQMATAFSSPDFNMSVVRNFLLNISKRDGFFKYGVSQSKDLKEVFATVTNGNLVPVLKGTATTSFNHNDKNDRSPAEKWEVKIGDTEATFYVEKNGNRMYLDASPLKSGASAGSELYAALFNYAHNAGKVFIGDPGGLSVEALYRRTEHMLSAALKFQTTRMMEPHPNQLDPRRPEYGQLGKAAAALQWETGNDAANIESLLMASYNNTNTFLGVGDDRSGRYNVGLGRYESNSGQPLSKQGLELIAQKARKVFRGYQATTTERSEAAAIGRATVERALYLGAVLRESGSARGLGLLAEHAREQAALSVNQRTPYQSFYSQPDQITPPKSGVSLTERLGNKLTDLKPAILGAIPMNYLTDFAHRQMDAVRNYIDARYAMETMRNNLHTKYDAVAQEWLGVNSADKGAARDLADLMHDSTIAGVDPSEPRSNYFDSIEKSMEWDALNARYEALPNDAKGVFTKARDSYIDQIKLLEDVLVDNFERAVSIQINRSERTLRKRIKELNEDAELTDAKRDELLVEAEKAHEKRVKDARKNSRSRAASLRLRFEQMRVAAPYFPLSRFGSYSVSVKQDGKVISYSKFETMQAAETYKKAMLTEGYDVKVWVDSEKSNLRDAVDPMFIADVDEILSSQFMESDTKDSAKTSARKVEHNAMLVQMRDAIYQRYLESLPDLSMRKSFIHRKKTAGFSEDALRAYTSTLFHGSYQIARLRYGMEMGELLDVAQEQAVEHDPVHGMILVNEMRRRHEWVMNPKGSAAAQVAATGAFAFYLGANPAHLFLNATQTAMVGVPILGSKYGFSTTIRHLWDAASLFFSTGGDISKALSGDELSAMREFERSGLLDKTQSNDLAGIGENGVEYSALRQKWMAKLSWFFHKSEVFNREVTALAAYRLAREADGGKRYGHSSAVRVARNQTYQIHFDYSNANRPRYLQSDAAKILLVFRNYNINILYRLFRDINDSLRSETPQAKAEARKQFGAMMGMYALMAGATGVPFYGLAMAIAGAFDDDDEPFTTEDQMKQGLIELLGEDAARVVLSGIPGTLLNVDLRERVGLPNLWFRSPDRELEGRDYYYYWMEQLLGAGAGVVKSMIVGSSQVATGLGEMNAGQVQRGVETMLPTAARSVVKAGRYAVTGEETNLDGDTIAKLGPGAILARALGFTPQDLATQYDANNTLKAADAKVLKRRTALMNRYGLAARAGDVDGMKDALAAIMVFNRANPGYGITRGTLDRSLRQKARNDALAMGGIVMNRRMQSLNAQLEGEE